MNEQNDHSESNGETMIQSIVDGELDFISSMNFVGEADFSSQQWRQLSLGLLEDRLMRSAAVQFHGGENRIESSKVMPAKTNGSLSMEHGNQKQPARSSFLMVAASLIVGLFSFAAGLRYSADWSIHSAVASVEEADKKMNSKNKGSENLPRNYQGDESFNGKDELVEGQSRPPASVQLVNYPVDIEQLQKKGKFDRSDIDDAFITREQRQQLVQSGFMVDELVGTTVLTVSPRVQQPVATRIICVRFVGDLSVQ